MMLCAIRKKVLKVVIAVFVLIGFFTPVNAQLADTKCKFLGNIIAGSIPNDFSNYWNQVTPENAGKWGSVEPTRDAMNWSALDNAYNFAKNHGFAFKQHTFVWGQQQPSWINTLSMEEQREEVEEWIRLFCERYPATDYIDVVNEPFHATPSYDQALGSGWNWVIWAFQKARQYCPNAKLILNDYNIISSNSATDAYVTLINQLKAQNLIDIIGEQGHFLETTDNATITNNLNKLYATGIPIQISEYDVNIADDAQQRDKYVSQFPVLWGHPGVHGITLWGYKQNAIWREDAYLLRADGSERPAMTWLKSYMSTAPGGSFCYVTNVEDGETTFLLYPNPATHGKIIIESKYPGQAKIKDAFGRTIASAIVGSNTKTLVEFRASPGVYVVEMCDERKTAYKKLLID